MTAIIKDVVIPPSHKITVELPSDWPTGLAARVVVRPEPKRPKSGIAALCGKGKGKFTMSPDFDAPLDDFAEYM